MNISSDILGLCPGAAILMRGNRAVYANPAACAVLGRDCVGKSLLELFGEDVAGAQAACFAADVCIGSQRYILHTSHADGLQAIFLTLPEHAPELMSSAFFSTANSELMNMTLQLDAVHEKLRRVNDSVLADCFMLYSRSYYRLLRLFSNASIFRDISHDALSFLPRSADLSAQMTDYFDMLCSVFPEKEFRCNIEPGIMINADPQLINILLSNLVSNCIRHSGCSRISLSLIPGKNSVMISVTDNGAGIAPEQLPEVFCSYKYRSGLAGAAEGSGFGLTVVRGIAEKHLGTLLIESRRDIGTTVRVSLSRAVPGPAQFRSADEAAAPAKPADVLMGLAECMPDKAFREVFIDD